ncbi:hypothetical protein GIB67_033114 [Kingdonia uniflora]|uniref:NAC domain-containing protein n=1 Tax=Kingdonia uniflora TaxID=39325 RepID=A0A7J7MZ14_9MAGN|nr:hypothetical protein GIB67_033114 [Kingdonia uniflora]
MEEENNDYDKIDEIMLPGFRFHPTDEELVGFYLKRKIQQRPLSIELIKQLDIYKYDPWDLPKELASTGEKEWYFYCPRDRKYRNSARPNRVTGAGFWKATGTDRPIYASEGSKCIGLKKSLVFYRGRAAKGIKTDWMMHEFRLPSLTNSVAPKRPMDKNPPPNDSWAICRIFKKTNTIAQRALSHSWASSLPETTHANEAGSTFGNTVNNDLQYSCITNDTFSPTDFLSYKPPNPTIYKPSLTPFPYGDLPVGFMFSTLDMYTGPTKYTDDVTSMLLNMSPSMLEDISKNSDGPDFIANQQQNSGFSLPMGTMGVQSLEFPFTSAPSMLVSQNFPLDSPPCPTSDISTCYSTNKCYSNGSA